MALETVALELVAPAVADGPARAREEAAKLVALSQAHGLEGRIRHLLIPGMIAEDDDRPLPMTERMDVLDVWRTMRPDLPGMRGVCTQVTAFSAEPQLTERLQALTGAGFDAVIFVGVPRTMHDGEGSGVAPTDALERFADLVPQRGAILIPTRDGEQGRFAFKVGRGANLFLTQLLYSDAIVGMLAEYAAANPERPEVLLSFGHVAKAEVRVGLIRWLIQDHGNPLVAQEQAFVGRLAECGEDERRRLLLDLYRRVVDGVRALGFPVSIHLEAPYGLSAPAFTLFADLLEHWAPDRR